jgi:anaphase-promoting complex subunit 2
MLADTVLVSSDFDTEKEVHNLELLKLRFGEMSMRQCEIMIKDIDDSKRIASNIHSILNAKRSKHRGAGGGEAIVDVSIISHIFWPPLQKESINIHPKIQAHLDEFSNEYANYKKPRRLVWFQQLGQVQLELEVTDEVGEVTKKEFTCSPLHATLISHFEDHDGCWTPSALSNVTGVSEDIVKKRMGYWINHKVVEIIHGPEMAYKLSSKHDGNGIGNHEFYEEDDRIIVSLSGQEEEEWEVYESYVVGMLSNLGQLPLERIHNMLKTFVTGSEHKYNKTPQQLSLFLQKLCKDEKLDYGADGMYKLMK